MILVKSSQRPNTIAKWLLFLLVQAAIIYRVSQATNDLKATSGQHLERRSGKGYTLTNGGRTQVAISLERVKNPDDDDGHGYGKKRKKFPITWLRNQYPFNAYYKKRAKKDSPTLGKAKETLDGQYSQPAVEFLDPNPSTWVKIPDRPTATIKFQKQSSALPADGHPFSLQPPASLVPDVLLSPLPAPMQGPGFSGLMAPPAKQINFNPMIPFAPRPNSGAQQQQLMVSESQQTDYAEPKGNQAQQQEPGGFGGISLSFGNGRSISFGGGQGLTIGGRAGAISIGGKNQDNTPAASAYSGTKGGGGGYTGAGPSYQTSGGGGDSSGYSNANSYSSDYGSNSYVNKHPTMSVDMPRKGKTIVHADLDMAPIKFRLHSSPRVKITTGSRDPLEKPSDEELTESEEDIFEAPEPFPKVNSTSAANETMQTSNMTGNAMNGTELTTLSPMQVMQQFDGRYPKQMQGYYNEHQQQQHYHGQYQYQNQNHHQHQYQVPFDEPPQYTVQQQQQPFNQVRNYPPQIQQFAQQGAYQSGSPQQNSLHHHQLPYRAHPGPAQQMPFMNQQPHPTMVPMQQTMPPQQQQLMMPAPMDQNQNVAMQAINNQGPGVNQWRQYSKEAIQQMERNLPKQQQLQQPHLDGNDGRFYQPQIGVNQQVPMGANNNNQQQSNMIMMTSPQPQPVPQQPNQVGEPSKMPNQNIDGKSEMVDFAASNAYVKTIPLAPKERRENRLAQQPAKFDKTTVYQLTDSKPGQQQQVVPIGTKSLAHEQPIQAQESNYYGQSTGYQQQQQSSYANSDQAVRTYTFGQGGISSSYGSGDHHYPSSGGSTFSDGFDRKHYSGKVEKFDPEAHDKRERSKVVLFLRPRISIHTANSSTTTKRPKNQQRFLNVVNRPIFLNNVTTAGNASSHHEDENWVDPDLAEPFEIKNYGYGYGYGQNSHYYPSSTTSTTKKPKRTTTTTTTSTTTVAPTEAESTTVGPNGSSTETSEITTSSTPSSTPETSDSGSTETSSSPAPTTTTSTTSSSTSTEAISSEEPSVSTTTVGSETSSPASEEPDTSPAPTTSEPTAAPTTTTTATATESAPEVNENEEVAGVTSSQSPPSDSTIELTTPAPAQESDDQTEAPALATTTVATTTTTAITEEPADLVTAATELTRPVTALPTTTLAMATPPRRPARVTSTSTSTTTTTTTTTSTTTSAPQTTTTTLEPEQSTVPTVTTGLVEGELETTTVVATTTTTTPAPLTTTKPATTTTSRAPETDAPEQEDEAAEPTSRPAAKDGAEDKTSGRQQSEESAQSASLKKLDADEESNSEFVVEPQGNSKRSARQDSIRQASFESGSQAQRQQQQQQKRQMTSSSTTSKPMLLNPALIDKLMNNKTLVNLMSSQLKRVIDTEKLDDGAKERIVRQVFVQMMEERVDFSMNNVRLAVKTVSSSYKTAAQKQRQAQRGKIVGSVIAAPLGDEAKQSSPRRKSRLSEMMKMSAQFGKRAPTTTTTSTSTTAPAELPDESELSGRQHAPAAGRDESAGNRWPASSARGGSASKSFPVIDTALKLTKQTRSLASAGGGLGSGAQRKNSNPSLNSNSNSTGGQQQLDSSGNPIVVVLLPQERRAAAAAR